MIIVFKLIAIYAKFDFSSENAIDNGGISNNKKHTTESNNLHNAQIFLRKRHFR